MKDSQPMKSWTRILSKYIKESNERFSTKLAHLHARV